MTNNKQAKTSKPQKKSALDKFKVYFEKDKEKPAMSPTFGKKDVWIFRAGNAINRAVAYFFYNSYIALKAIIKEIM